ncbi:MAG: electron transfer flavoprotein subunit alpha/FixB family protein [Candidatus Bathyarchaeota archaeon]|jgi:electron transfer flavoprotein alpha subunit
MAEIIALAEHRQGALRDVTFEILVKGRELAETHGMQLSALLLGSGCDGLAEELAPHADRVLVVDHPELADFNAEVYQRVIAQVITEREPRLTLIGHTSFGIDLAPALAVELGLPLATDCIELEVDDKRLRVTRQVYGGKLNVEATLINSWGHLATIRPATFNPGEPCEAGEVVRLDVPVEVAEVKRFVGYVEPPVGEVDIADAEIIISIGRGIKDEKNLPLAHGLAEALKGEVGCSRPIVDKGWLPKDRQVGSSGKTVKPKVYIASGISGSFQHVMGMKASDLIVAVNKDPKAPIFRIADYGVVDDLFKILPALTEKINEFKETGEI